MTNTEFPTARVIWKARAIGQDINDPGGVPEEIPLGGIKVDLIPSPKVIECTNGAGDPVTYRIKEWHLVTANNGELINYEDPTNGIEIVASDAFPGYVVSWKSIIDDPSGTLPPIVKNWLAPAGSIVDLTTVISVPNKPNPIADYLQAVYDAREARDNAGDSASAAAADAERAEQAAQVASAPAQEMVDQAVANATKVQQVTLTAPLAYALPVGTPANTVHHVTFTQDGVGGHTVTYDGQPVTVDLTAGASTTVELHPVGAGHAIRYPVTNLDAQVSALAEDGGSALGASLLSTYATRIRAGAPRLTMSHAVHHTGGNFRWANQTDESYVTFHSFYHLYNTNYKTTGPVYALSRPLVGGTLQHVWKSIDGGETWAKMFELTISQSTGVWFEHIFVEPYYETVYLQKTTTGYSAPYAGFVESYTPAGVLIGSKAIGDSRWISGNHAIDYCPNTKHVVIFGEYASDTQPVVNLWRTENRGATWTSVLAPTGGGGGTAGEVRHFHAVAADPYTKHWWAASGDADAQCKIYRSMDDGVTWTVLYSGTQRDRTTSFVFTPDYVYYGTDYPALTDNHSKLVRITKSDLSRTDVATVKDGFPVWALTKTYAPEGILVWPSCEFAFNTPQDYVTVQWFDFATEELLDVARFTIADYTTGNEGIHVASRHQDVMTGSILFAPTSNVQRRGGFDILTVSAFSKGRLVLPSA